MLFRHLPRHYPANSVYALFPFMTPKSSMNNLGSLGIAKKYNFDRPKPSPIPKVVDTIAAIRHVFDDPTKYWTPYGPDMRLLTQDYGFFLIFENRQQ